MLDMVRMNSARSFETCSLVVHCFVNIREGRKASLWSWHSDGESSPDEMPDYDRMKSKKQSKRHQAIELEEGKHLGYDLRWQVPQNMAMFRKNSIF